MSEGSAIGGHRGTRAIQRMVEFAPATGGLALWMRHVDTDEEGTPVVRTDGRSLFYTRGFEALSLPEQIGHVAHEVLHVGLRHPQRYCELVAQLGEVDLDLFNRCADAIVNSTLSHLGWLKLPKGAVLLDQLLQSVLAIEQPVEKSLLEWDVERLYRAIEERSSRRTGRRHGQRSGPSRSAPGDAVSTSPSRAGQDPRASQPVAGAGNDLVPGPATLGAPELEAEEARDWSERIARAHAGDGEFSMLRTLIADLPRSRTPWEQVLRTRLARALAPRRAVSWSRPSRSYIANRGRAGPGRRLPWEPGTCASTATPRLVLVVDVSGSIHDDLLERFTREINAITRRLEVPLVLVIGDDRVRAVVHHEPGGADLGAVSFEGRGGTDFTPLLEEADRHGPDITVVLTDLDGPARIRPRWPVLWAVPESSRHAAAPFGRIVPLR
jgi:predicted metal-dependent peptidase